MRVRVAALGMAFLVACELGGGDGPLEDTVVVRTARQSARATLSIELSTVTQRDAPVLAVGSDTPRLIVAFPSPPVGKARCVDSARLFMTARANPRTTVEMGVYPSLLVKAHRLEKGDSIEGSDTLLDNRPRADAVVSEGPVEWNVTELYRLWVKGGPFPSRGGSVSKGAPFVVGLRPVESDPPHVRFDGVGSAGDRGPRLEIDVIDGCETPRKA